MRNKLYLLGSGIRGTLHFTRETVQAIKACRTVHVLHPDSSVAAWVTEQGPDVNDVSPYYDGKTIRDDAYRQIAEIVVDSAASDGPNALLVHGHPLFLVSAAEYILDLAKARGVETVVLPSVSSFDTILADLGIDYGYGVQIFDTTTLLNNGWYPNPAVPTLLFQVATTLNPNVVVGDPQTHGIIRLVETLEPIYGPDHEVVVISSASTAFEDSVTWEIPLGRLADADYELWRRPTLYVPAVR